MTYQESTESPFKCRSYCGVVRYWLGKLERELSDIHHCTRYDEVLQVSLNEDEDSPILFFYQYGAVVGWNLSEEMFYQYIAMGKPFSEGTVEQDAYDDLEYRYGPAARIGRRLIHLPDKAPLTKLAMSHAMAQSVKLEIFEFTIQKTIDDTAHIPKQLAATGRQPLAPKSLLKRMGQLYIDRSSINLHFDLLDEPEFFWDFEELEPLYGMTSRYLDVQDRIEILNQKLQVVGELFQMLSEELKHNHSSRLEWIIIILIAIEVAVTFSKDIFNWI